MSHGNQPSHHHNHSNGPQTFGNIGNEPPRHRDRVSIYVQGMNSSTPYQMDVDLGWTADFLRQRIADDNGMNSSQIRISCGSKPLDGKHTLREAGITRGSTVHINGKLRGG